jgi:hypothetical protein
VNDSPAKMAAYLRDECLRSGVFDIEDVDAFRIACWLDELAALRAKVARLDEPRDFFWKGCRIPPRRPS